MVIEEKILTLNLKKSWIDRPKLKRHTATANSIRDYFYKHMEAEDVKISSGVNQLLHKGGSKWVPGHIQVKSIKDGKTVHVLLPDEKMKPKEKKKTLKEKLLGKGDAKEKLSLDERKELEEFKKKKEGSPETKAEAPKAEDKQTKEQKPAKEEAKPKTEEKK